MRPSIPETVRLGALESLLTVSSTGVPLRSWVYSYDPAGNPISKTDLDGNVERYGYDSRGRLVRAEYPDGEAAGGGSFARFDAYRYDPVGNRIDEWREHGTAGAVTHVEADFDDANRLLRREIDAFDDDAELDV